MATCIRHRRRAVVHFNTQQRPAAYTHSNPTPRCTTLSSYCCCYMAYRCTKENPICLKINDYIFKHPVIYHAIVTSAKDEASHFLYAHRSARECGSGWFDGPEQQQYTVIKLCDVLLLHHTLWVQCRRLQYYANVVNAGAEWVDICGCVCILDGYAAERLTSYIYSVCVSMRVHYAWKYICNQKNRPLFVPSSFNFWHHSQ